MLTIYHNPRCSKSREGVAYLEAQGIAFDVIKYLDNPLSVEELKSLLQKLNIPAIELVRTKESLWKEVFTAKDLSEEDIIAAMSENPKLIERPIIVNGDRAVIARPIERIEEII